MDIDFLTENPQGHGFSFTGIITVLLSVLLHMATEKLTWDASMEGELPQGHPLFDEIFSLSVQLSNCISRGKSTGASNFVAMLPNVPLPVVFLLRKNGGNWETPGVGSGLVSEEILYKDTLLNFLGISPENAISELPLDF